MEYWSDGVMEYWVSEGELKRRVGNVYLQTLKKRIDLWRTLKGRANSKICSR